MNIQDYIGQEVKKTKAKPKFELQSLNGGKRRNIGSDCNSDSDQIRQERISIEYPIVSG